MFPNMSVNDLNFREYGAKQGRTIGIYPELKHSHAINKVGDRQIVLTLEIDLDVADLC